MTGEFNNAGGLNVETAGAVSIVLQTAVVSLVSTSLAVTAEIRSHRVPHTVMQHPAVRGLGSVSGLVVSQY